MIYLRKYWPLLTSFVFLTIFVSYYYHLSHPDYKHSIQTFERKFQEKEKQLVSFLDSIAFLLENNKLSEIKKLGNKHRFYTHVFKDDSLVYWNTNKIPISKFVDLHFPANGLLKLQNGWYFSKAEKVNQYIVCCSFLIRSEYLVENEYLSNSFCGDFKTPFPASILLEKDHPYPVFTSRHKYLFSIQPEESPNFSDLQSHSLLGLYLTFLAFLFFGVYRFSKDLPVRSRSAVFILFTVGYFIASYFLSNNLKFIYFLEPTLYGNSMLLPNFFILISHVFFLVFIALTLYSFIQSATRQRVNQGTLFLLAFVNALLAFLLVFIVQSLVRDSSIPMEMDKLFQLSAYSFWSAISMGLLLFSYFVFLNLFVHTAGTKSRGKKVFVFLFFFFQLLASFVSSFILEVGLLISLFPLLIATSVFYQSKSKEAKKLDFKVVLLELFLSSLFLVLLINETNLKKEISERKLYAKQLASEQDISTEIEFDQICQRIQTHAFFGKTYLKTKPVRSRELKDFLEKNFYTEFWDRYEIDFSLYFPADKRTLIPMSTYDMSVGELDEIITRHSKPSEINKNFFYIKDYTSQLSYVSKISIVLPETKQKLILYALYKSKRIPQKIGFPKLLISGNANVLKGIENYSMAKYYRKNLVSQNGDFSFPSNYQTLLKSKNRSTGYFNFENYDHFIYKKNRNDVIVLSKREFSVFQLLTAFSYLSCFYGFFVIVVVLLRNAGHLRDSSISFALKIQVTLIVLILVSLISFGLGSGIFVKRQYEDYVGKLIMEKIHSVHSELKLNNPDARSFSIENDGDYLNNLLTKLSRIFLTDINMYDKNGYLLATSRQKVFNLGLVSEQINPQAFRALKNKYKSELIQNESIGNLEYSSAYFSIYNKEGRFLSFVNLQYFDQQQGFVNQIEKFLVSIINTFILLLVFSVIIAVAITNWLTNPLRILQKSLLNVQMGKYNEPITYASNDEIGELVKNYNQKLNELAFTANQLAQSEREFAWREMAKQVAHEIKNPLTPMKLSLQHLQRVYDPSDPISSEKLGKIVLSLVEQIDTLSQIANEFSNFAKLPKEKLERIDILPLITNTVFFYQQQSTVLIRLKTELKEVYIQGDKNLLLQVFNNLITNSIQALSSKPEDATIQIEIIENADFYELTFTDNGPGIAEEMLEKIFEPNFTTKSTGSGLGLALSRQIIDAHQGNITFETESGVYTKFIIQLPKI